jgi:hypothetical protein
MAMHDDGREGDQVAGDGLWSVLVPASPGQRMNYYFGKDATEADEGVPGRLPSGDIGEARDRSASGVGEIDTSPTSISLRQRASERGRAPHHRPGGL